ncbi:hypothetical protein E3N88_07608 [Mikania micrantha]|uniref:Uncharacterized protein n=1 Tax=Mikania micrantha TaxID=192012 RepID=A0A5N6PT29_9ASTR|nr:hypothetical protein E3N88_07608 [Mikania micrantha]
MGKRDVAECNDLFESFAQAEYEQRSSNRNSTPIASSSSSKRGVHHVNVDTSVAAALESLARDVKELKMRVDRCEICRGGHATSECLVSQEQANYVGGQGQFGHYPQNQGQGQPSGSSGSTSGAGGGLGRIEELLAQLVAKDATTQKILHEHDVLLKNQQSAFLDLQRTVGDIAKRLDERPQGQFPGQPQTNPNAHVKAVTTRSGGGGGERFIPPVLVEVEKCERVVPPVDSEEEEPVDEEIEMENPERVPPRLVPASTAPNNESLVEKPAVGKPIAKSMRAGGELVHQVDGVNMVSDEVSMNKVVGGGPWDVGNHGHDRIAREEVFDRFDAIKMNWSHQGHLSRYTRDFGQRAGQTCVAYRDGYLRICRGVRANELTILTYVVIAEKDRHLARQGVSRGWVYHGQEMTRLEEVQAAAERRQATVEDEGKPRSRQELRLIGDKCRRQNQCQMIKVNYRGQTLIRKKERIQEQPEKVRDWHVTNSPKERCITWALQRNLL